MNRITPNSVFFCFSCGSCFVLEQRPTFAFFSFLLLQEESGEPGGEVPRAADGVGGAERAAAEGERPAALPHGGSLQGGHGQGRRHGP